MASIEPLVSREILEGLYEEFNHRRYVSPDPLECLYDYPLLRDREIVALIASSLAYGRVTQIVKSVRRALGSMGSSPYEYLLRSTPKSIEADLRGFKHRFTGGRDLAGMLAGIKRTLEEEGSLQRCFLDCQSGEDLDVIPALDLFSSTLRKRASSCCDYLLPSPERGSACKRLNLFLRWMVRKDEVDCGGWTKVSASKLIIPLDTHMHRICLGLRLTGRKQPDLRTALELTEAFREFAPEDPVRYDFALTRLGIRDDASLDDLLRDIDVAQC